MNGTVPTVDHIVDGLYIGGAQASSYTPELRQMGITHVLKLYFLEPSWSDEFVVCNNPLNDGEFVPREVMLRGVAFIREAKEAGGKVLVACGAGISRSSTFVLAYLVSSGYDLHDAWRLLRERHPDACPAMQMWKSLLEHFETPYKIDDVVGWWFDDEFPLVAWGDATPVRRRRPYK